MRRGEPPGTPARTPDTGRDGPPAPAQDAPGHPTSRARAGWVPAVSPWALPILLVALFITFAVLAPHTFGTLSNIRVMLGGQATIVLLAMAFVVPLRAGDFDLSVSAVMILAGCLAGVLTAHGYPAIAACGLAVLIGPLIGAVNGILVVTFGIDSFISTLGTMTILTGIATLVSNASVIATFPPALVAAASATIAGLPATVWSGWLVTVLLWYLFELTPAGRYLQFIGGNRDAAHLAGLPVAAFRHGAFLFSGTLSSITGLLFAGSLGSVNPSAGAAYLLPPITAVFLGASTIHLGRYNIAGTLTAIYLLAVGITGLQLLGLSYWVADVFNGACLVVAVGLTRLLHRPATT